LLIGVEDGGAMRHDLLHHRGAHVLAAGIHHAMQPPFVASPGARLAFAGAVAPPDRPALVLLEPLPAAPPWPPPTFTQIAPAWDPPLMADGPKVLNFERVRTSDDVLELQWTPERWASLERLRLVARTVDGRHAAIRDLDREQIRARTGSDGILRVPLRPDAWGPAADAVPAVWWCEGWAAARLVFRTPWAERTWR
jgi:hypothetical protein